MTEGVLFKPLSLIQQRVLGKFPAHFGLVESVPPRSLLPAGIRQIAIDQGSLAFESDRALRFQLGLTREGEAGIIVQPDYCFADKPVEKLSDEELDQLINQGFVPHIFVSNSRQLILLLDYNMYSSPSPVIHLQLDAIDVTAGTLLAGTYCMSVKLDQGVSLDDLVNNTFMTTAAQQYLAGFGLDPKKLLQIKRDRKDLREERINGDKRVLSYVNLAVANRYRNSGNLGFVGLGQLLQTTMYRIAAEQMFSWGHLSQVADGHGTERSTALVKRNLRDLGAVQSAIYPTYGVADWLIFSFCGPAGIARADSIFCSMGAGSWR